MDQESIGATEQEHIDTGAIADCCVIDHVLTAGLEQENSTASTSADCYAMDQQMTVDLEQADTIITPDTYSKRNLVIVVLFKTVVLTCLTVPVNALLVFAHALVIVSVNALSVWAHALVTVRLFVMKYISR